MEKHEVTRIIAETLRDTYAKFDAVEKLTRFGLYEYFDDLERIEYVLCNLLNIPPWESDTDILRDYLHGRMSYEDMLSKIDSAIESFDPDVYQRYLDDYEQYLESCGERR